MKLRSPPWNFDRRQADQYSLHTSSTSPTSSGHSLVWNKDSCSKYITDEVMNWIKSTYRPTMILAKNFSTGFVNPKPVGNQNKSGTLEPPPLSRKFLQDNSHHTTLRHHWYPGFLIPYSAMDHLIWFNQASASLLPIWLCLRTHDSSHLQSLAAKTCANFDEGTIS
jgi:hypothetical protein